MRLSGDLARGNELRRARKMGDWQAGNDPIRDVAEQRDLFRKYQVHLLVDGFEPVQLEHVDHVFIGQKQPFAFGNPKP